jgi:hypothetical protein
MPDHGRLELLHRDLHLPAPRTDPGGRVLREPGQDLGCGLFLRRPVRGADVRVQLGRERPRFRPVDDNLDEPHRLPITAQPTLRHTGLRVAAVHPRLIRVTSKHPDPVYALGRGRPVVLR